MRANIIVFPTAISVVAGVTYALHGPFEAHVVVLALTLMPVYGVAVWLGTRLFPYASDATFRRIAYAIITGAAVEGLPAFDRHAR